MTDTITDPGHDRTEPSATLFDPAPYAGAPSGSDGGRWEYLHVDVVKAVRDSHGMLLDGTARS